MCIPEGTLRAYVDGELGVVERDAVDTHLIGCQRCRALIAATAERRDRVQGWMDAAAPTEEPRPVAVALAELRSRLSTEPARAFSFALAPAVSVALVVVAVAALGIWATSHSRGSTPTAPGPRADSDRAGLPPAVTAQHAAPQQQARRVMDRNAVERLARPLGRRSIARPNRVERYVLLADDTTTPDMGMVVRVKVPVSFPARTSAEGADGGLIREIEADVLVTQDGRPYAVRLVQDSRSPGRK